MHLSNKIPEHLISQFHDDLRSIPSDALEQSVETIAQKALSQIPSEGLSLGDRIACGNMGAHIFRIFQDMHLSNTSVRLLSDDFFKAANLSKEAVASLNAFAEKNAQNLKETIHILEGWISKEMPEEDILELVAFIENFGLEKKGQLYSIPRNCILKGMTKETIIQILETAKNFREPCFAVFKYIGFFLTPSMTATDFSTILNALTSIDSSSIEKIVLDTLQILIKPLSGKETASILEKVSTLADSDRTTICATVKKLLSSKIKDGNSICDLLDLVKQTPPDKMLIFFQIAHIKKNPSMEDISFLYNIALSMDEDKFVAIIQAIEPWLSADINGGPIARIIKLLSELSERDLLEVCAAAPYLIKDSMSGDKIYHTLTFIARLPKKERVTLCQGLSVFFPNRKKEDLMMIVEFLMKLPSKKRKSISLQINDSLGNNPTSDQICSSLIKQAIINLCPEIETFLKPVTLTNSKFLLLHGLLVSFVEKELLGENTPAQEIQKIISKKFEDSYKKFLAITAETPLTRLNNLLKLSEFYLVVECIFSNDFSLRTRIMESIYQLSSAIPSLEERNRNTALEFAKKSLELESKFNIQDDHPLIQDSIKTILSLELDRSDKYFVYALIKQMKKAYADVASTIEPTTAFLEGGESVSLELNYEGLHTGIQRLESKTKTYQEFTSWIEEINKSLPPGSPPLAPDIFQKLLTDFWTHIKKESQTDPGNERLKKLLGEITEIYNNFTSSDRLVTQLMEAPFKQPDEIVDRETERLYAIGAALLQKKSKPSPGELLSEREELIIAWLPLIEECSVGQARGIAVCYNQFKVEGAIPGLLNEVGSHLEIDNSLDYLDDVVQKTMEEILPEVLEELGITKVEGVHQALALKNILAKEAGLNHSMTIDPYGGWVDQNLLFQKREDVLRIFFSILTKALVISLKKDTTEAVNTSASKLYDNLMVFFEASGIDPSLAWQEIEGGFLVHFKEGQKEPITLLTAIESLREFPLEESFWEIKGSEIFLKEDGARFFGGILPSGALKEEQAAEFLRLVQIHAVNQRKEIIKSNLKEELKHALVQEEKENGSILLTKQAQAQFKALYRDKDPSLGLSLAEFSEFLTGRLSELVKKPAKLDLFISQEISKWQSSFRWSLKEAPSSYKLTNYGAIAFLKKGGYLK